MTEKTWQLLDDAAADFGLEPITAKQKARDGQFPCHVYKLSGRWVIDLEVKRQFFEARRQEGLAALRGSTFRAGL